MAAKLMKTHHSFSLSSRQSNKKSLEERLLGASKRCDFVEVHGQSTAGSSSSDSFQVHVVKRGETLTSISKRYGVSVGAVVAVNKDIVNINLVFDGQRLSIPVVPEESQMQPSFISDDRLDGCRSYLNIQGVHGSQEISTAPPCNFAQHVKSTRYILAVVPLVAFCIKCIIKVSQHRVIEKFKQEATEKSHSPCEPVSSRWRTILSDLDASDTKDADSRDDSNKSSKEDQSLAPFEEMSQAYTRLEPAYLKFLSECGMSKWGYWRGGSKE